jgi:hypothetical protein
MVAPRLSTRAATALWGADVYEQDAAGQVLRIRRSAWGWLRHGVRGLRRFYLAHWKWIITTLVAAVSAFLSCATLCK